MSYVSEDGVIDLRKRGVLHIDHAKLATEIAGKVRDHYTSYTGELAKKNSINGFGWLLGVSCRNPYHTTILDKFSKLELLDKCLADGQHMKKVVVDDLGMQESVKGLCEKHNTGLTIELLPAGRPKKTIKTLRRFFVLIYISLISIIIPKLFYRKSIPSSSIYYIDTFVKLSDFGSNGEFFDRYYGEMREHMNEVDVNKLWYSPVIYLYKTPLDFYKIYDKAKKSSVHFLLMEQWLRISDYLYAFYVAMNLPRSITKVPKFRGVDVSTIIMNENSNDFFSTSIFGGVLRFRFMRRLKEAGVVIEKIVDWSENQVIDRALNLGAHKYYPETCVTGYQGYIVSEHYVSHEPACYEKNAGTIPDRICVVNDSLIKRKKRYCHNQKVSISPAFRFQYLMDYNKTDETKERNIILLALPVHLDVSQMIIEMCVALSDIANYEFVIKLHPAIPKNVFLKSVPEAVNEKFTFTEKVLIDLFFQARLLVSSDSSVCFEAVTCGVPVVIVGNKTGPTSNPLLGVIDPKYWKVCYTLECVKSMLDRDVDTINLDVSQLLTKVSNESVDDFLSCSKKGGEIT